MKYAVAGLIILLLAVLGIIMLTRPPGVPANRYENESLGISFAYPSGFVLFEREVEAGHYQIVVTRAPVSSPENGEGPTAVTLDAFTVPETVSLYRWMTETNASNYRLGSGVFASTTLAGQEALAYGWSGLYEGKTVIARHEDGILAVSATTLTADDETLAAYDLVLDTLLFR